MTSTISPVGQVRDDAVPVVAAVEAAPVHLRPIGPDAGGAVLTLAVLAVAVTDPGHPAWAGTALALAAVAVGWGGGPAFHRHGPRCAVAPSPSTRSPASGCSRWPPLPSSPRWGTRPIWARPSSPPRPRRCAAPAGRVEGRRRPQTERRAATARSNGPGMAPRCRSEPWTVPRRIRLRHRRAGRLHARLLARHRGRGTHGTRRRRRGAARRVPARRGTAAPTALVVGTSRAAALGAFLDGPRSAEALARVDTVVLCRTGTLTTGARALQAVHVTDGVDADEALRIAGAVARRAGRPEGRPVPIRSAPWWPTPRGPFGELPGVAEFDGYPGLGVRGIVSELLACADARPTNRASWRTPPWSAAPRCSPRTGSTCPPSSARVAEIHAAEPRPSRCRGTGSRAPCSRSPTRCGPGCPRPSTAARAGPSPGRS